LNGTTECVTDERPIDASPAAHARGAARPPRMHRTMLTRTSLTVRHTLVAAARSQKRNGRPDLRLPEGGSH